MNNTEEESEKPRFNQLQEALASDPNNASHHFNLGLFLWESGESKEFKERAVEHFVASAKLNPNNAAAFRYLGHYYSGVSVDRQRASKCYQRAVTLNPDDFEAGEGLCDLLDEEGKESLEASVCREALEKSPRAFWAFRRLGYMQVYQKKWSEAIQSLQHAIRGYPTCAELWEALGLAYQHLGMFTAAIKSYGRAIELEVSRIFALIESGNVLLMLGSFRKGVEHFRRALEIEPHNVAAHYGLASGLLGLSKDCVDSGAFGWGASLLEEASDVMKASTCLAGNISSIWKLNGDIQIAYSKCYPWDDGQILENDESFKNSIHSWKRKRLSAAISASRSYQRALHLTPWQANIYSDIAICLDLVSHLEERTISDPDVWQLPEKMSLGALLLESDNNEFWVVLGCLSNHIALRQHALIRGLQLDVSLAVAWAYLGQIYRSEDDMSLSRQAFDRARSIDPSLALPWAGMSVDTHAGCSTPNEAYECCLRAAQILPLPEFQVGLGKLATVSGHLLSPQVFGALRQAVQRAPHYPESHNFYGLACEARSDYQAAISAYRKARCAIRVFARAGPNSRVSDVSANLARSLCKAGHAVDAARECEDLKKEGLLDVKGLQVYALALWQLGKNDLVLSVARSLAANVSIMDSVSKATSLALLISKLMYCILGQESTEATILKMPKDLLQNLKIISTVSVLGALNQSTRLPSLLPGALHVFTSYDEVTRLHSLIAAIEMIKHGSEQSLGIRIGVQYLRKVLHTYPDSTLIRNQLSSLMLSSKEWQASHNAIKCIHFDPPGNSVTEASKSAYEILGSAAVSCYASCSSKQKLSFPTCREQSMHGSQVIRQMQRWLHQEPWNHKARYLLILNILQKTREENFPQHLCFTLNRLLYVALSNEIYSQRSRPYHYQKFQLLLCASEISLQGGDYIGCINHAQNALQLPLSDGILFFAHLQLCRAYASQENLPSLKEEYMKCLQLKADHPVAWISLKLIESRYKLHSNLNAVDLHFESCLKESGSSCNTWTAIFNLVQAQKFIWEENFILAEKALACGISTGINDSCLYLCHGAICMELARRQSGSQFLSLAVNSLTKAQKTSFAPIISALLAQAEASLGARMNWERNLRLEWFSWPAESRPAELYFQMHLLARQSKVGPDQFHGVELSQSPLRWILQAIHLNPSCLRYWKILHKLKESK